MKRHPSLIPLSQFHRSVLFLALICKKNAPPVKGYPQDDAGKRDYALTFYTTQLRQHMDLEEEKLFPAVTQVNDQLNALVTELLAEHQALFKIFEELRTTVDLTDTLDQLGVLLEKHVRKEERQFFQLIQQSLDETGLIDLGDHVS